MLTVANLGRRMFGCIGWTVLVLVALAAAFVQIRHHTLVRSSLVGVWPNEWPEFSHLQQEAVEDEPLTLQEEREVDIFYDKLIVDELERQFAPPGSDLEF